MEFGSSNDFVVRKSKSLKHERPEDLLRRLAWTFLLSSDRRRNELLVKRLIKSVALVFASITGVAGSVALIYALWRYMNNRGNKGTTEKKSRRVCVVGAGIAGTFLCLSPRSNTITESSLTNRYYDCMGTRTLGILSHTT